jgi:ribonuclease HII
MTLGKLTIAQIQSRLMMIEDEDDPFFSEVEKDDRKGVGHLIDKWRKEKEKARLLEQKYYEMNAFERKYQRQGFQLIAGVDEVGRGPLAGPVAAAAVILPNDFFLPGLDDSKKLSEKKREEYNETIHKEALAVSISMISNNEIDELNIYEATKKAMKAAIAGLYPKPDFILIDAMKLETPFPSESIIKGDAKSTSIAAASIVAKVARDNLMKELSRTYPQYGFDQNMGYGTQEHINALYQYGITPYHRKSFAPIKDMMTKK